MFNFGAKKRKEEQKMTALLLQQFFMFQGGQGLAGSPGPLGAPGMRVRKELHR